MTGTSQQPADVHCLVFCHDAGTSRLGHLGWDISAGASRLGQCLGGRQRLTGKLAADSVPTTAASRPLWLKGSMPLGFNASGVQCSSAAVLIATFGEGREAWKRQVR